MGCVILKQVFKALRGGVQVVAVKVLKDEEVGGVASFIREIAILKGCRHTNIVQFQARHLPLRTLRAACCGEMFTQSDWEPVMYSFAPDMG